MNDLWDPLSEVKGCLSRLMLCLIVSVIAAISYLPVSWIISLLLDKRYCQYYKAHWMALAISPILAMIFASLYLIHKKQKWNVILLDGILACIGTAFLTGIVIPNIDYVPPDRCRQKNAIAEMKDLDVKLNAHLKQVGKYPVLKGLDEFNKLFHMDVPLEDPWRNAYYFKSTDSEYWIICYGKDGKPDVQDPGQYKFLGTRAVETDIVMHNGQFIQAPEWLMPAGGSR